MCVIVTPSPTPKHGTQVTAVAHREVHCFGMPRENFLELMETYPKEMQELVDAAKSL